MRCRNADAHGNADAQQNFADVICKIWTIPNMIHERIILHNYKIIPTIRNDWNVTTTKAADVILDPSSKCEGLQVKSNENI